MSLNGLIYCWVGLIYFPYMRDLEAIGSQQKVYAELQMTPLRNQQVHMKNAIERHTAAHTRRPDGQLLWPQETGQKVELLVG